MCSGRIVSLTSCQNKQGHWGEISNGTTVRKNMPNSQHFKSQLVLLRQLKLVLTQLMKSSGTLCCALEIVSFLILGLLPVDGPNQEIWSVIVDSTAIFIFRCVMWWGEGQGEFLKIINDKRQSKPTASKDQCSDCMWCTNSAGHLIDHMTFSITMSKLWRLQSAESSISVKGHWGYARPSPSIIHRFALARHILKRLKMCCSCSNLPFHKYLLSVFLFWWGRFKQNLTDALINTYI